jgi:Domain of unknown function (DUF4129)
MKPDDNTTESLSDAAQRRRQQLLSMPTTEIAANPSLGERLLPFLLAAMEACWVDAIFIGLAGLNFFQSRDPIIPVWAPFVLIAASQWLSGYLERRSMNAESSSESDDASATVTPGISVLFGVMAAITLFIVWSRVYAQTAFVLDPRWLLSLLNDVLLLNSNAYLVVGIAALSAYFCWRGVRLSRHQVEPANVFNILRLGLIVFVVVIIVRAAQESAGIVFHDWLELFLLVPIFFLLSLIAHSLARAAYVRHSHPVGLEGSAAAQERSIMLLLGTFGLAILILALLVGNVANPALLQQIAVPLGAAYDWLIGIIAHIIVFLVTPIFWLINLIFAGQQLRSPSIRLNPLGGVGKTNTHKPQPTPDLILVLIPILRIALPILFILGLILLIRWALRRRRVRVVGSKNEDVHENLWSWALFWTQLKAFLRGLFGRFFSRKTTAAGEQAAPEAITGGQAARSVREIYRLLLRRAADRGYPRKKDETPYEFRQRLDAKTPLAQPRLEVITGVYTATRYGGLEPDESEVARVRGAWAEIEQQWKIDGSR